MENKRTEVAEMLIKYFNYETGWSVRTHNEKNVKVMLSAYDRAGGDVHYVKAHIKTWVEAHKDEINTMRAPYSTCMYEMRSKDGAEAATPFEDDAIDADVKPVVPEGYGADAITSSLGLLEKVVVEMITKMNAEKIESDVMNSVEDKVRDFIKEEYGTIERKVVTVVDDKRVPMQGITHEKFDTILKFVSNNEPVFLSGPAGSGKNVICKQIAEALGLKFYFTNAVTQEYKLTGFTDANGVYQETQFYKAFTQGGVFMLDEMDASIPEVLVILNAAIANGYFDFPAPIGYVEAHPDFRVVAAGNTFGTGADISYVGRNQLDGASLDRFAIVRVDYSPAIENAVACGDTDLVSFCDEVRRAADRAGIQMIVSYRAIGRLAKMSQLLSVDEALETCLIKGMEQDDVNHILNGLRVHNKYSEGLKVLAQRMAA